MSETDSGNPDDSSAGGRAARQRQEALARGLRRMYDDVVAEPVPDDFLGFLRQADELTPNSANPSKSGSDSDRKDG